MKKCILLVICICLLCFVTTACGSSNNKSKVKSGYKVMNCTRLVENSEISKTDMNYELYYKGNYVMEMHSVEKITAEEEILNKYKTAYENSYSKYKDLKYYNHKLEIKDDTLISTVDIDYTKIDMDKLEQLESSVELKEEGNDKKTKYSVYKDGKVLLDKVKDLYEKLGANCKK